MNYINDIRDLVGHTPLLKLNHIYPHKNIHIFGKLEYLNPGGSMKDRIGLQIIADAEASGALVPGGTIIEATAGNTGIGLALAAFEKGYHLKLVVPKKFSIEKQTIMKALGAELIITPTEEGIEGAMAKAEALAKEIPNAFLANQFNNPSNVKAHRQTGKEIYDALDGKVDILVAGAGSGGTIMGIASYLKEKNPNIKIVLSDPEGSILGGGDPGTYLVEGIGNHFIPSLFHSDMIDTVEKISDDEAYSYVELLGKKEGVLVGSSSGASLAGAIKQAKELENKHLDHDINIVAIFADRSERYFSQNIYDFHPHDCELRFNDVFDEWSDHYDETISSDDGEYVEVFEGYDDILTETVNELGLPAGSRIIDIGSGTGNLTHVAVQKGYAAIGLEPNLRMRQHSLRKYPDIPVVSGSFLSLPFEDHSIDGFISTYAFHHLSDSEKAEAARRLRKKLRKGGKVIITDTMYTSPEAGKAILEDAKKKGYVNLYEDLQTEFYTTHEVLQKAFEAAGFTVSFKQRNKFVWTLIAKLI